MQIERIPADVDEATFTDLGAFLVKHSRELAPAPVDMNEAMTNGYHAVSQGMSIVARDDSGEIIGALTLVDSPLAWCVDPARRCLVDYWFVVTPEYRGGGVRTALEAEALAIGEEKGLPVYVFKRRRIR